jgi:agmatinase
VNKMDEITYAYQTSIAHSGFLKSPALTLATERPFVVAGIPWDGSTTHRPGARQGPGAIRKSSHMLCDGIHPHFDCSPLSYLADAGDLTLANTSLERMRESLMPQARQLIASHHMIWLGGDHSITLPLLRAYRDAVGEPLAVIHFDAHCDTWSTHFNEPSGHGTWVYEAVNEGLMSAEHTVQIGIRSAAEASASRFIADRGGMIYTARAMRGVDRQEQWADMVKTMKAKIQNRPVYLTLDIDCLDPAFAPGTGTPEPAGLTSNQLLGLLEELSIFKTVGMDLTEVAPAYDWAELTSNVAAHAIWTYLCGQIRYHR